MVGFARPTVLRFGSGIARLIGRAIQAWDVFSPEPHTPN